jgi:chloramphenicol 3-O-phosphotransferase
MKLQDIKSHPWFNQELPGYLEALLNKKQLLPSK